MSERPPVELDMGRFKRSIRRASRGRDDGYTVHFLNQVQRAAKEAGWSEERFNAFVTDATSGDHHHLLAQVMEHFDVRW